MHLDINVIGIFIATKVQNGRTLPPDPGPHANMKCTISFLATLPKPGGTKSNVEEQYAVSEGSNNYFACSIPESKGRQKDGTVLSSSQVLSQSPSRMNIM